MSADYVQGLADAHKIVTELSVKITAEHEALPANFFGSPTRRHNELLAQSRILRKCTDAIFAKAQKVKP